MMVASGDTQVTLVGYDDAVPPAQGFDDGFPLGRVDRGW
jgi:hypothetical protein